MTTALQPPGNPRAAARADASARPLPRKGPAWRTSATGTPCHQDQPDSDTHRLAEYSHDSLRVCLDRRVGRSEPSAGARVSARHGTY